MSIARTVLKNTLSNWAGMIVATVVNILITPYVLKHLGDERYGIYQIVSSVIRYLILLELGIRGSVARFASKYIQAYDAKSLNEVISTTFMLCCAFGTVVMGLSFILGLLAPHFFDISAAYRTQSLFMFVGLGISTVVSFLSYSFSGVLIGRYRYELYNVYVLITVIGRAVLVVLFFGFGWVSLTSWATTIVLAGLLGLIYIAVITFWIQPGLRIGIKFLSLQKVKELWGFGLWNMLMQLSALLVTTANPIIIGRMLGLEAVPYYAIPFMLVTRLQSFVRGLTATLMPYASSTLVSGNKTLLRHLLVRGTYMASMLVFPLGAVLLVMCKDLFRVWLPAGYESSWMIYAVLMIAYFGSITQTTSYYILLGGGDIRGMGLVYLTAGIFVVILAIIFMGPLGWGLMGAALALVIPQFIATCLFQPWYISRQAGVRLFEYIRQSYAMPVLCTVPSVILGALIVYFFPPTKLIVWALEYFVALLPFGVFAVTGVLDWPMRRELLSRFGKIVR